MWIDQRGSEILPVPECLRLLALAAKQEAVGRIAVSRSGAPIVQPVNFGYAEGRVFVRLGEGAIAGAALGALVAFEVDRVDRDASVAWSVLVRGLAVDAGEPSSSSQSSVGLSGIEPLVSVPGHRLIAIRTDVVTGRRLQLKSGAGP